eukprot:scaffold450324_cov14-Prasinocladus_malaysianus.AAC.1
MERTSAPTCGFLARYHDNVSIRPRYEYEYDRPLWTVAKAQRCHNSSTSPCTGLGTSSRTSTNVDLFFRVCDSAE